MKDSILLNQTMNLEAHTQVSHYSVLCHKSLRTALALYSRAPLPCHDKPQLKWTTITAKGRRTIFARPVSEPSSGQCLVQDSSSGTRRLGKTGLKNSAENVPLRGRQSREEVPEWANPLLYNRGFACSYM